MTVSPYRIKTKKEFIEEFGQGWRMVVDFNYHGRMDYLLGEPVDVPDDCIAEDGSVVDSFLIPAPYGADYWAINEKMVTNDTRSKRVKHIIGNIKDRIKNEEGSIV